MGGCQGRLTGCLVSIVLLVVIVGGGVFAAREIEQRRYPDVWEEFGLDDEIEVETDGQTLDWYESATYGSTFELVSGENEAAAMERKDAETLEAGDRTFTRFAESELDEGTYRVEVTASPFANDAALIAYGEPQKTQDERRTTATVLGLVAGGFLAYFVIRGVMRVAG